ncbi:MAG: hypothetical protein AAGF11_24865 [Myxococcota bacterium]
MTARVHRWGLVVSLVLVGVPVSPAATAAPKKKQVLQDKEARAHFNRAQEHFESEDYEAAIPELKAAYALEPNPMLLYAWAQAERLAGSCARAMGLYRRYLETDPPTEQRQLAEANVLDCEAELPPPPEPEPESEPEIDPMPEDAADDPPASDEPNRPWHRDPAGGVLFGLGLAGVASGGTLMGVARIQGSQAPDANIEDDYLAVRARAERMNIAGIVTLGVGSALLVGGVIRYAVVASKGRRRSDTAFRWAPIWTGAGGGVGLKGTF